LQSLSIQSLFALFRFTLPPDALKALVRTLSVLFASFDAPSVLNFQSYITAGLQYPVADVRILALTETGRCLVAGGAEQVNAILECTIECLAFPSLDVVTKASDILVEVNRLDEIIRFRVSDLVSRIVSASPSALSRAEESGLLNIVREELLSPDIMLQLNAIDLFGKLLQSHGGFDFLERANIFHMCEAILQNADDDVQTNLVKTATIKMFAKVAAVEEADVNDFAAKYQLLETLENILNQTRSTTLKEAVIVATENIGSTVQGLLLLDRQKTFLESFLSFYRSANGSDRVLCLQTLSTLLGASPAAQPEVLSLTQRIFESMGGRPNAFKDLMTLARSSFEEPRIASYAVIKAVASNSWGLIKIRDTVGILDFLLDRSTDHSRIGK
ncbi:26S proteasome non-ATPase regulatory subunit 5, partial [Gonapodya sp. JEL0774]